MQNMTRKRMLPAEYGIAAESCKSNLVAAKA